MMNQQDDARLMPEEKLTLERTARKKYARPLLIVFGDIVELTRGGTHYSPGDQYTNQSDVAGAPIRRTPVR